MAVNGLSRESKNFVSGNRALRLQCECFVEALVAGSLTDSTVTTLRQRASHVRQEVRCGKLLSPALDTGIAASIDTEYRSRGEEDRGRRLLWGAWN